MVDPRMPDVHTRLAFIDALKAVAFQLIVLHHLAFYGPMSDHAYPLAPALISWLSQDARMAVQAFGSMVFSRPCMNFSSGSAG